MHNNNTDWFRTVMDNQTTVLAALNGLQWAIWLPATATYFFIADMDDSQMQALTREFAEAIVALPGGSVLALLVLLLSVTGIVGYPLFYIYTAEDIPFFTGALALFSFRYPFIGMYLTYRRWQNGRGYSPPSSPVEDSRGAVQLVDVVLTFFTLVPIIVLAPVFYKFTGMASSEADPFSSLLLQLVLPMLVIALIISVGVSARRS